MRFIGQESIVKELDIIIGRAVEDTDFNPAILFTANSGLGKTDLGLRTVNVISKGDFVYSIADKIGEKIQRVLSSNKRVIFIDEIHLLETPEIIYPTLDNHSKLLILATNQSFKLNEALRNRCINLIFMPYTQNELREITKVKLPEVENMSSDYLDIIVRAGENNPRRITNLCIRLQTIARNYGIPRDINSLNNILSEILNIRGGLNPEQQSYMEVLRRLRTASLETLCSILHYDKTMVKFDIEPSLLYNQLIEISPKGRTLHES